MLERIEKFIVKHWPKPLGVVRFFVFYAAFWVIIIEGYAHPR